MKTVHHYPAVVSCQSPFSRCQLFHSASKKAKKSKKLKYFFHPKSKKQSAPKKLLDEQTVARLIQILQEENVLDSFLHLIEQISNCNLSPSNIAVLGALERAKLLAQQSSIGMVYDRSGSSSVKYCTK